MYNIVHGPEIWLAISIWAFGAACGIAWCGLFWSIDKRRDDHDRR